MTRIAWVYLRWGLHPWEKNYNDQDWALFKTPNATRELWRCWCSPTRWYITPTWRRDSPRRFQGLAAQNGNGNDNDNDNDNFFGPGTKEFIIIARKNQALGWPWLWQWQYYIDNIYLPRRWWTSAQTPVRSTGWTRQTANWFVLLWKYSHHWNYLFIHCAQLIKEALDSR